MSKIWVAQVPAPYVHYPYEGQGHCPDSLACWDPAAPHCGTLSRACGGVWGHGPLTHVPLPHSVTSQWGKTCRPAGQSHDSVYSPVLPGNQYILNVAFICIHLVINGEVKGHQRSFSFTHTHTHIYCVYFSDINSYPCFMSMWLLRYAELCLSRLVTCSLIEYWSRNKISRQKGDFPGARGKKHWLKHWHWKHWAYTKPCFVVCDWSTVSIAAAASALSGFFGSEPSSKVSHSGGCNCHSSLGPGGPVFPS